MYVGTVKTIVSDKGYGFIKSPTLADCFFHRHDLADDLEFDSQLIERRVKFSAIETSKGPRATLVQAEN